MMKAAAALLAVVSPAAAWWDGGHMLVAQVAQEVMEARGWGDDIKQLHSILKTNCEFGNYSTITTASTWADKIKAYKEGKGYGSIYPDIALFSAMHYLDMPLRLRPAVATLPDADLRGAWINNATLLGGHTVVNSALRMAATNYPEDRGSVWGHDMLIRLLIHLVGDLHMPLHSVEAWDEAWCLTSQKGDCRQGDRGGNSWALNWDGVTSMSGSGFSNLHALWDSGCGQWSETNAESTPAEEVVAMARAFMSEFPADQLATSYDLSHNHEKYMIESYRMSLDGLPEDANVNVAAPGQPELKPGRVYVPELVDWSTADFDNKKYPTFNLNDNYLKYCQAATRKRVVLGGHRLADALHQVATHIPAPLLKQATAAAKKCGSAKGVASKFLATGATLSILAAAAVAI